MRNFKITRKYLFLVIFMIGSTVAYAGHQNHTNFLPMEDSFSSVRNEAYGATVNNIKPYRQQLSLESETILPNFSFGSTDFLICVLLLGVYVVFSQKKSRSRNAGL